jgi:hypothetical protein
MATETVEAPKALTKRQRKYVDARVKGAGQREAARQAGYSASTVTLASRAVERSPAVQSAFQKALAKAGATDAKLAQVIAGGLDAEKVTYTEAGEMRDPDWYNRHKFADLTVRLKGHMPKDDGGAKAAVQVQILHIGGDEPVITVEARPINNSDDNAQS